MPLIDFDDDSNAELERIAPSYLKGSKMTTRRVHWAIEALVTIYDHQESGRMDAKERISDSPPLCPGSN